jgi:tryptophanyl-tRNA synthetase
MSLRDGTKKMSKSDPSDYSRINLTDDADTIAQKVRKAKTDPEPLPSEENGLEARPEADNLVGIYAALSNQAKADDLEIRVRNLKKDVRRLRALVRTLKMNESRARRELAKLRATRTFRYTRFLRRVYSKLRG